MEINNLAGQNLSDSANLRTRLARWVGQNLFYRPELIYIFLLALILRLLCLILSIGQIGIKGIAEAAPDSVLYFKMAKDLLSGTSAYEHGFFTFGPGFAYYLAFNMIFFGQY